MVVIVGLTGNIASGKSIAGQIISELGIPVLDSDAVVDEIYQNDQDVKITLKKEFGTLDRKLIGQQVFGEEKKEKRKLLESIIHPAVDLRFKEWVKQHQNKTIIVNLVPLLFEAKLENRYDLIITITTTKELQRQRLKIRNPELSNQDIEKRIASQISQEEKINKSNYVIDNSSDIETFRIKIKSLMSNYSAH